MGKRLKFALSLALSAGILALVFHAADSSAAEVARAVAALGVSAWTAYAAAQLLQGWLRAVRYRLLLGSKALIDGQLVVNPGLKYVQDKPVFPVTTTSATGVA